MTIEELRNKVEQELQNTKEGTRISYSKEQTEMLLFNYINVGEIKIKLPVWSGPFLSKLDLSEVDFSNVYWGANNNPNLKQYFPKKRINYSNTNAHIDLGSSYSPNEFYQFIGCDFQNTDLSPTKFTTQTEIDMMKCNFKNTRLTLEENVIIRPIACNFENTHLRNARISTITLFKDYLQHGEHAYNNFHNTGIKFHLTEEEYQELAQNKNFYIVKYTNEKLYWGNCQYNGETIENEKTRAELAEMQHALNERADRELFGTTDYPSGRGHHH